MLEAEGVVAIGFVRGIVGIAMSGHSGGLVVIESLAFSGLAIGLGCRGTGIAAASKPSSSVNCGHAVLHRCNGGASGAAIVAAGSLLAISTVVMVAAGIAMELDVGASVPTIILAGGSHP